MKSRRSNLKWFCPILICMLILGGCKASPALVEEVYTQQAQETKQDDKQMEENKPDNKEQTEELAPVTKTEDSDDYRERNRDLSVYDEKGSIEAPASEQITIRENIVTTTPAPDSTESVSQSENSQNQEIQLEVPEAVKAPVPKKKITVNGSYFTVPEKVDSVGAVGEAAVIVSMLGGSARLLAASEDYTADYLTQKAFFHDNIKPETLWENDGSYGTDEDSFTRLLALAPKVVFEFSGENTFDEDQYISMQQADITCVTLPRLNTTDNIRQAVQIIGEVLGDRSGEDGSNAPERAREYITYMDSVLDAVGSKVKRATCNMVDYDNDKAVNGTRFLSGGDNDTSSTSYSGKYSIFISHWEDSAAWQIYNSLDVFLSGNGAAVVRSGYSSSPMSYYMSLAGVINTPAMFPDFGVTQNWYVNPMIPSTKSVSFTGSYQLPSGYCLTLTDNNIIFNKGARTNGLGSDTLFPAIVVANREIKTKIEADSLWKSYGYVSAKNGDAQNFGCLAEDGSIIESTIIDSYDIYVNPRGIGSWSEGSAESVLEPVWLAWKFYDAYTQAEVEVYIREFYQKFYGYELSKEDLAIILSGL